MNFISFHFISKTLEKWKSLVDETGNNGFFYFKEPIVSKGKKIDRIGKGLVFAENEIIPITWEDLIGGDLISIYDQVKNNRLYFFRESNNRYHKVKLKCPT